MKKLLSVLMLFSVALCNAQTLELDNNTTESIDAELYENDVLIFKIHLPPSSKTDKIILNLFMNYEVITISTECYIPEKPSVLIKPIDFRVFSIEYKGKSPCKNKA